MFKKIFSLMVVISFLFIGIVAFAQPKEPIRVIPTPMGAPGAVNLSVSPATATGNVGSLLTFIATVTRDGQTPIGAPGVEIRFEFMSGSVHHPKALKTADSYVIEWGPLGDGRILISEHWKKEKVYSNSNSWVYCASGPKGQAAFKYVGIYGGTDSIKVSATVDGQHLEAKATARWRKPTPVPPPSPKR